MLYIDMKRREIETEPLLRLIPGESYLVSLYIVFKAPLHDSAELYEKEMVLMGNLVIEPQIIIYEYIPGGERKKKCYQLAINAP